MKYKSKYTRMLLERVIGEEPNLRKRNDVGKIGRSSANRIGRIVNKTQEADKLKSFKHASDTKNVNSNMLIYKDGKIYNNGSEITYSDLLSLMKSDDTKLKNEAKEIYRKIKTEKPGDK